MLCARAAPPRAWPCRQGDGRPLQASSGALKAHWPAAPPGALRRHDGSAGERGRSRAHHFAERAPLSLRASRAGPRGHHSVVGGGTAASGDRRRERGTRLDVGVDGQVLAEHIAACGARARRRRRRRQSARQKLRAVARSRSRCGARGCDGGARGARSREAGPADRARRTSKAEGRRRKIGRCEGCNAIRGGSVCHLATLPPAAPHTRGLARPTTATRTTAAPGAA